jgi:hypothetical protein
MLRHNIYHGLPEHQTEGYISMASKTYKQKQQEEEYKKWKREQQQKLHDSEDMFGLKQTHHTRHVNKYCSVCGSPQAWRSSDHGMTWQCFAHAKD